MNSKDQLIEACEKFLASTSPSESLENIDSQFIDIMSSFDRNRFNFGDNLTSVLAKRCEVAPSTIARWATGTSVPGENVKKFVIKTVIEILKEQP